MTETREQLVNSGSAVAMSVMPWGSLSAVPLTTDLMSKVTFNKTWHIKCMENNVSKILDWLV